MAETIALTETYSPSKEAWRMFVRNKAAVLGLILFIIMLLITFLGPYLYDVDPFKIVWAPLTPPGADERVPLGTDYLGRDVMAGLINGGDATLFVAATAAAITVIIGVLVGAFAGYYGGMVDAIMMRTVDALYALPFVFLVILLMVVFERNFLLIFVAKRLLAL